MKFDSFIAFRYLKHRNIIFFNFSNTLSLLGIIIGVFSILVVSSVMNGFNKYMIDSIISSKSEIWIFNKDHSPLENHQNLLEKINKIDGVVAGAPVCKAELMLQKDKNVAMVQCFGIDLEQHKKITDLKNQFRIGDMNKSELADDEIIIGLDLSLQIRATVGEKVKLTSPIGTIPTSFGLLPKSKTLKVVGIIEAGLPEYDKIYCYVSLKNAKYFLNYSKGVDLLEVKTTNPITSHKVAKKIQKTLGGNYKVENWSSFDSNLFNAISMEKNVMFLVLSLIFVLVAFNMTGNFIKLVTEKKMEIAVLKAIGTSNTGIKRIFLLCGVIIGLIGVAIGVILSLGLLITQQNWNYIKIPIQGFPLNSVPVNIKIIDFLLVPAVAFILCILASVYPAGKTAKTEPIEVIKEIL